MGDRPRITCGSTTAGLRNVRLGSRLCENSLERRPRRIVFSISFVRQKVPMQFGLHNDEIETEIIGANWPSEFSHSLGQSRHFGHRPATSGLTPENGHRQGRSPCLRSTNNGRSSARCDRRAVIAASIRIYALVARGHRLRDGRRRERRAGRPETLRREIRVLVVADPYAGIGDEPVSGGDRVARA